MLTNLLVGVSLPLVLAGQGAGPEWTKLAPKGQGFSVLMPGAVTKNNARLETKAGVVEVAYYVAEHNGLTYVVSVSSFPKEAVKADTREKRLDNAREGALKNAGGTLESEKAIRLQTHPGRDLLIRGSKGLVRTRIFAVGNRLYQTMVVGASGVDGEEPTRFLDSLKFVK